MHSEKHLLWQFKFLGTCLLLIFLLCAWQPLIRAQEHPAQDSQGGPRGNEQRHAGNGHEFDGAGPDGGDADA